MCLTDNLLPLLECTIQKGNTEDKDFCLFGSLCYPQHLEQCRAISRCSINSYYVNEWISKSSGKQKEHGCQAAGSGNGEPFISSCHSLIHRMCTKDLLCTGSQATHLCVHGQAMRYAHHLLILPFGHSETDSSFPQWAKSPYFFGKQSNFMMFW